MWISLSSFHNQLIRLNNTFFIFDSIELGLFVVVGVEKNKIMTELSTAVVVILIRTLSVRYQWHLPILKGEENKS